MLATCGQKTPMGLRPQEADSADHFCHPSIQDADLAKALGYQADHTDSTSGLGPCRCGRSQAQGHVLDAYHHHDFDTQCEQ